MRARLLAIAIWAAGCAPDDPGLVPVDAAAPADAAFEESDAAPRDASVPLSWVDFAISGCAEGDALPGEGPCTGTAPLTLRFIALSPASIDVYRWSFGDDSEESTARSPAHTFELPGTYDVSLTVGGPGGTARAAVAGAVEVAAAEIGATCDVGLQCETGSCICGDGACAPAIADGLCAAPCDADSPCATGVCADLAAANPAAPEPWQRSLCLRECEDDGDCPSGRACMDLPAGDAGDEPSWVRGCFPRELLAPIGGGCLDAAGEPDHERCASGLCVAEGARGMCAADCETAACPVTAACADFADEGLGALCVHRCTGDGDPCASDPWLACEPADGGGSLGFSVDEDPVEGGYCAPKACADADDCGPDGACEGGFCGPA